MNKNLYEILSAYIDGELSPAEKIRIEEKIKSSLELQKKLAELQKIKSLTAASYKTLPESPYFETRLFAELGSRKPWYKKIAKWSPAIGFAILAVALMLVLKFNPDVIENLIENQKTNIAGFYKENLKPLLFTADLNNKDIFNFAMYKKLPLDKSNNQYLEVGYDPQGKEYIEIKKSPKKENEDSYDKFVNVLNLDKEQKEQIDSIINQYAEGLTNQVLVNENSTVAVNANLWNYRRAILTDIMQFAENTNSRKFRQFLPEAMSFRNNPELVSVKNHLRHTKNKSYIILTPDSIFSEDLDVNQKQLDKNVKQLQIELNNLKNNEKAFTVKIQFDSTWKKFGDNYSWKSNFKIKIDTNFCRIDLPGFSDSLHFEDRDKINLMLDSAVAKFKDYSFFVPRVEYFDDKIKFNFEGDDSSKSFEFKTFSYNLDSLMESQKKLLDSLKTHPWKGFFNFNESDSLMFRNMPQFKNYYRFFEDRSGIENEMKELREELKKFREEMKRWQKEFKNQRQSQTEKEVSAK